MWGIVRYSARFLVVYSELIFYLDHNITSVFVCACACACLAVSI